MQNERRPWTWSVIVACLLLTGAAGAQQVVLDEEAYVEPPDSIKAGVVAPWHENVTLSNISPDGDKFLVTVSDGMPTLERMGRPWLTLGESSFDHVAYRSRRMTTHSSAGLRLYYWREDRSVEIQVPDGTRVTNAIFSPDGSQVAYFAHGETATHVRVADATTGESRRITETPVLATLVTNLEWSADGTSIRTVLRSDESAVPEKGDVAHEPRVRVSRDGKTPTRTYRFLLQTPHDKEMLEHLTTGQPAVIDVATGAVRNVGAPGMVRNIDMGPKGDHFRVTRMTKPFSYFVPTRSFGSREDLVNAAGESLEMISERKLREGPRQRRGAAQAANGANAEPEGEAPKRGMRWLPDGGIVYLQLAPLPKKGEQEPDPARKDVAAAKPADAGPDAPAKKDDGAKDANAKPGDGVKDANAKPGDGTPPPVAGVGPDDKPQDAKKADTAVAATPEAKDDEKPAENVRKDRVVHWYPPFGKDDVEVIFESEKPISSVSWSADAAIMFVTHREDDKQTIDAVYRDDTSKKYRVFEGKPPRSRFGRFGRNRPTRTTTPAPTTRRGPTAQRPGQTQRQPDGARRGGRGMRRGDGARRGGRGMRGMGRRGGRRGGDAAKQPEEKKGAKEGTLMSRSNGAGDSVVRVSSDGAVYFSGTEELDEKETRPAKPFIDRVDIKTGKVTRIFEGKGELLESISAVDGDDIAHVFTSRQDRDVVPDTFVYDVTAKKARQVTRNKNFTPWYNELKTERFKVKRVDGFEFWVTVTKNPDYGEKLPAIFWFYPREYTSQESYDRSAERTARTRGPNSRRFQRPSSRTMKHLTRVGYVVVEPDMPIFGEQGRMNDNYIPDLRNGLWAVIDELDKRKIIDRDRLGIGGHSYGAFSTANAMAHTPFFKAGIAGDGNFNRTLTPMSFQSERRHLWDARETYMRMSPLFWANQFNGALLMYHGMEDANTGTFPINSVRLFQALDGVGKPASLYMYPYEGHGPAAKETVLDLWGRWSAWLDKYVKNHGKEEKKKKEAKPGEPSVVP